MPHPLPDAAQTKPPARALSGLIRLVGLKAAGVADAISQVLATPHGRTELTNMRVYSNAELTKMLMVIFAKIIIKSPTPVIRMEVDSLLSLPQSHPHLEPLIQAEQPFHILAGPGRFGSVAQISTSIEIAGMKAHGKWALWPVPFQSAPWQQNYLRLARYRNYEKILPGYSPDVEPFQWPSVCDRPGMLWEFESKGETLEEFYENLATTVRLLDRLCTDVIACAANEYAFFTASIKSDDISYPPPQTV